LRKEHELIGQREKEKKEDSRSAAEEKISLIITLSLKKRRAVTLRRGGRGEEG